MRCECLKAGDRQVLGIRILASAAACITPIAVISFEQTIPEGASEFLCSGTLPNAAWSCEKAHVGLRLRRPQSAVALAAGQAKIYRGSIARDPVMVIKSAKGPGKRPVALIACPYKSTSIPLYTGKGFMSPFAVIFN